MIELRFKQKDDEKVLQFRTKTVHRDSSTTTPIEKGWTEWLDVPIIEK